MKKELRIFFTALMFLTRLPVPKIIDHNPDYLQKAAKYFPMIGWAVGIICGLTFAAGNFLSTPIAAVLCIIAGLVTTGAFHEDGFADVCDGFGGGWTKYIGMVLTILTTYIYIGWQIIDKRFIDHPATKTSIQKFFIHTNNDSFKTQR